MKNRGAQFKVWVDLLLHTRTETQIVGEDGMVVDVQARLSRTGSTQMFMGVYEADGRMVTEEYYPSMEGETMTRALFFGSARGFAIASGADVLPDPRATRL